jgi:UDP-glucose 4-epimerase
MSTPCVLVTGGAGFIGSHVAERFARDGWAVRVLDNLSTGDAANCQRDWELRRGDVCDAGETAAAVEGARVVVHLAAFTSVPESFERFEACYRTNVWGSWNVFDACAARGVNKLVFASSSAVYAELPDAPKSEADCPDPISPYGVSKLEGEHLLDIQRRARGLASAALRFFNVYGPRQPADSAYAAAIPIFVERGLARRPLTIYGDGHQTRDFVYVTDVAEAVFRCAVGAATGVLNVGTGVPVEVLGLADRITALTGADPEYRFEPRRPGDVHSSTADVARSAAALGWVPDYPLEKGLAETIAWWRARPAGR